MDLAWELLGSIREALRRAEFGPTPHPVFSPTHRRALAAAALDPFLSALRDLVLAESERPFDAGEEEALRLHALHRRHAALLYGLVPGYAAALEGLIEDVRFELGARASQVSGVEDEIWGGWGGAGYFRLKGLVFFPVWKAFRARQRRRAEEEFDRVGFLAETLTQIPARFAIFFE